METDKTIRKPEKEPNGEKLDKKGSGVRRKPDLPWNQYSYWIKYQLYEF